MTSRATSGQASPVMIWNRVKRVVPRSPKYSGAVSPNSFVAMTPAPKITRASTRSVNVRSSSPAVAPQPSRSIRWSPTRRALAMAVSDGFTAPMLGKKLVSTT